MPSFVAALIFVAGCSLAVHLAISPDPFAASSAAVIAIGSVVFTVITMVGITLVRGRWARRLGMVLVATVLVVAAVSEPDVWTWIAIGAGLVALGLLSGRWLDAWIRGRPSATGPDPLAVVLLLGLLATAPAVGLAAPGGLTTAHGFFGAGGVFLAWAYSKAQVWSLWAIRLVLPLLGIAAAVASPVAGAVALLALAGALAGLAWTTEARLAVQPLMEDLPGPRPVRRSPESTGE